MWELEITNWSSEKLITQDPTTNFLWTVKDYAHVKNIREREKSVRIWDRKASEQEININERLSSLQQEE